MDHTPLLTGDLAERATAAVRDVARELEARAPVLLDEMPPARQASLAGGATGIALFFAYLAEATGEDRWADLAAEHLDRASEVLASTVTTPGLFTGFAGVAWVGEHLTGRLFEADDEEDGNEGVDQALSDWLGRTPWQQDYDLILGIAGAGVYAVERLPRPSAVACLETVVRRLSELAREKDGGLAWHTSPELLPEFQRQAYPEGYLNIGVAHGIPGLLPVLAAAAAAGVRAAEARRLLDGAVRFLLDHRIEPESGRHFPYQVSDVVVEESEGARSRATRSAWCYGDPGVAAALWAAARKVGHEEWAAEAVRVALDAARVPVEASGVQDAGLCHGAAGLAHIYHRLYRESGEEALADAARLWIERTLDYQREGREMGHGIGGFPAYRPEGLPEERPEGEAPKFIWEDDPGFLTGAAGVGLALLAATSDVEPAWDRVLAISVP